MQKGATPRGWLFCRLDASCLCVCFIRRPARVSCLADGVASLRSRLWTRIGWPLWRRGIARALPWRDLLSRAGALQKDKKKGSPRKVCLVGVTSRPFHHCIRPSREAVCRRSKTGRVKPLLPCGWGRECSVREWPLVRKRFFRWRRHNYLRRNLIKDFTMPDSNTGCESRKKRPAC